MKGRDMPNLSNEDRLARKERVLSLLKRSDGLTTQEIADALKLERRTVYNYLTELEHAGMIYKDKLQWAAAPYDPIVLRRFELAAEEAMVLYLAARLFVKQADRRNEIAETVLFRLAEILSSDAGIDQAVAEAARQLATRPFEPGYQDIFRTIMRGYLYRQQVEIVYHPYRGEAFRTIIAPYLLEPSVLGFATYVICHSSSVDALRTYKLERIQQARLLHKQPFEIPVDFPGLDLLKNAWSIYYGEETIPVTLRFHPEVARRVRETNWHPSQQITEDTQPGYVCLRLEVADLTDLKPWIRTWGAHCEVLDPANLRDEMTGEARRMAHLYGVLQAGTHQSRFKDIFGE